MPRPEIARVALFGVRAGQLGHCASRVSRRNVALVLLLAIASGSTPAWAQQQVLARPAHRPMPPSVLPARPAPKEEPEWWKAKRDITASVTQSGGNLEALVKQLGESQPTTGQEAMFRLCAFTRAGMDKEAIQSLHDLKRLCPQLSGSESRTLYFAACDRMPNWEIARAVAEIFADSIHDIDLDRLENQLLKTGWTADQIDEWLAAKPAGANNLWVNARLRFNTQRGQGAALQTQLADRVRAKPEDATEAIAFLDALIYAHGDPKSLDWMAQTVKPGLAIDAHAIASRLVQLGAPASAAAFFRQAIDIPLTPVDLASLKMDEAAIRPESELRARFEIGVREELASCLASCLLKTDQAADAQKWLLAAAQIGEKRIVPNPQLADRVAAEAGQTEIAPILSQDAHLWQWLENRAEWERMEERLLLRMLGGLRGKEGDATIARAEKLALAGNASRGFTLATVERTMRLPARSVPLLTFAAEHAQNEKLKGRIHSALFNSYMDLGDWKHAEEAMDGQPKNLTLKELTGCYARLAMAAARAGAKDDALRLWKQSVAFEQTTTDGAGAL